MKFLLIIIGLLVLVPSTMALTYEEMARYPEKNIGASVTIIGEVLQADYLEDGYAVRMNTKRSSYGYNDDDLYVYFSGKPENGRILEDDIIQVTGLFAGPFEYTTILGATRSIPLIYGSSYIINPVYSNLYSYEKVICDCTSDIYNCSDFPLTNGVGSDECFEYCKSLGIGDIHNLDPNGNGDICEVV